MTDVEVTPAAEPSIDLFRGKYRFLSNFHRAMVEYDGAYYPTVEHAYQAAKTIDPEIRVQFQSLSTPREAKQLGQMVKLRAGWDQLKDVIMLELLRDKFTLPGLRAQLMETGDALLIEGNTWGDQYWGVCNGVGQNKLGKLLMEVRKEVKAEQAEDVKLEVEEKKQEQDLPDELQGAGWAKLRLACYRELGYALVYMDYLHPDPAWESQRERIQKLCCIVARDRRTKCDVPYWTEMWFRIVDNTENLC